MFAAATVVLMAMLATHCHSLSAREFEKSVGTCGVSPNENFDFRASARENEFPWNVLLYYTLGGDNPRNRTMCEGTIISRNFVITTAYCLQSPTLEKLSARLTFVRVGVWDRGSSLFTDIPVSKILVHNQFDNNVRTQRNNIGLVKLESNIEFGDASQPICLPLSDDLRSKSYENDKLITTGWGQTETELRVTKKQKVRVTVVPTDKCVEKYVNTLDERAIGDGHICAGGERAFDTCAGYAGAPLMALDESSGHWTLIGLTSLGPARCATTGAPAIYTRVGTHTNWILGNIEI